MSRIHQDRRLDGKLPHAIKRPFLTARLFAIYVNPKADDAFDIDGTSLLYRSRIDAEDDMGITGAPFQFGLAFSVQLALSAPGPFHRTFLRRQESEFHPAVVVREVVPEKGR